MGSRFKSEKLRLSLISIDICIMKKKKWSFIRNNRIVMGVSHFYIFPHFLAQCLAESD